MPISNTLKELAFIMRKSSWSFKMKNESCSSYLDFRPGEIYFIHIMELGFSSMNGPFLKNVRKSPKV